MTTTSELSADAEAAALYAEYIGAPVELVRQCVGQFGAFNAVSWRECPGETWEDKARVYYHRNDEYLFDLLHGSRSRAFRKRLYEHHNHWSWMTSRPGTFLEFGGGLGFTCSLLHEAGRRVTYCDVNGVSARFANWYFARTGQHDIEVLLTPSERLVLPAGRQWDLVFSDSVIEHVPDPVGTVERLAQAVAPGGLLYLIIDAHEVGPAFPMHRHVHMDELLAGAPTLRRLEHVLREGDGINAFVAAG